MRPVTRSLAFLLAAATLVAAAAPATRPARLELRAVLPADSDDKNADVFPNPSPSGPRELHVSRTVIITEADVVRASVQKDNDGRPMVSVEFTDAAAARFSDFTASHIGRRLAIIFDGKLLSAPNINSRIARSCVITSGSAGFSNEEADRIVAALNAAHPTTAPAK